MKGLFTRKHAKIEGAKQAHRCCPDSADPYALEGLEPRLLLAADLGAGLDLSTAWEREAPVVGEVFDELSRDKQFGDLQSGLSPLAGAIHTGTVNESAEPLDLTKLGGLFGNSPAEAVVDTGFGSNTQDDITIIAPTFDVEVSDGSVAAAINFTNVNTAPTISSSPMTAASAESAYSYSFTSSDVDAGDSLTITAPTQPAWLSLVDNSDGSATLSGAPGNAEVGDHNVVVRVNDGTVDVDQSFTIRVSNSNDAPTITSSPVTAVSEESAYSYNFTSSDLDAGDSLTITAPTQPAWLSLVDNGDGSATLSGTPGNAEVGDHNVVLRVNDGTVDVDQSFTIRVSKRNDNPTITSNGGGAMATINAAENQTAVTTVMASDVDLPANILTYSINGGADLELFSIDSGSGLLTFTSARDYENASDANSDGVYEVTVQVSDGTTTDTQLISVVVTDANDAPTVALSSTVTNLLEHTDTSTRIKVADIHVTDDGLGSNLLSLAGADVALFEIDGRELFLKAGTLVDFELQNAYTVAVRVDDTALGVTPDDQAALLVGVVDVNDPPLLNGIEPHAEVYNGGSGPVAVSLKVRVDDQDDTHIEWAVIKITANYSPGEDILYFPDTAAIKGDWDAASGTLTLVGVDSIEAYQAALRTVTYENLATAQDTATRQITLTVNDGEATSNAISRNIGLAPETSTTTSTTELPTLVAVSPNDVASTVDPEPSGPPEEAVQETTETEQTVEESDAEDDPGEVSASDAEEELSRPSAHLTQPEFIVDTARSDSDRAVPRVAKPSIADVLAKDTGVIIQKHAVLLQKLAIAPQQTLLNSIAGAVSTEALRTQLNASEFTRELDRMREQLTQQASLQQVAAGTALASSGSLAIGYVMWLFRGGALLSGFLSSMAAWQLADPLPVLAHSLTSGQGQRLEDKDSLESLVQEGSRAAREKTRNSR